MTPRVDAGELERLIRGCFEGLGLAPDDARAIAEVLVYADLRGLEAHGAHRVPAYMTRVHRGLARGTDQMREVAGKGAVRRLDAAYALGPAAATKAVDLAIELARAHGIGLVALGRSTHLGAAGFYARRAAKQQLMALVVSNGPKAVAPHGAAEPLLGTNPLAIGAPLGRHGEYVLDMSTGAIARERIRRAARAGAPIGPGAAVDAEGRPTTDARAALAGSVLPVGGAKGSGLGVAIALMAAMLCDAEFDDEIGSMTTDLDRPQNVGQVFIVWDPWVLTDRGSASQRVDDFVARLHGLRPAPDVDAVRVAGERGDARARERLVSGIPIDPATLEDVASVCDEHGLPLVASHARRLGRFSPSRGEGVPAGDRLSGRPGG